MTLLARWRTPAPAKRNDVAIYQERASAWWNLEDPSFTPLRAMARPRLAFLERAGVTLAGARVVDVGAGGGFVSVELAARGAHVVAVDLAPAALRAAHAESARRGLTLRVAAGAADALPLASAAFDLVVCTDVLVHVPDQQRALDELARVTAPGGCLYVASMNRTALARFVLITLGEDILGVVVRGTHDPATFIRPAELSADLARRGFAMVAIDGVGPVGLNASGLVFGRSPIQAVMYHALFRRS